MFRTTRWTLLDQAAAPEGNQALDDLPADLTSICKKRLRDDPGEQDESAEDLTAGLERWLRGERVSARPMELPKHLEKWTKRSPALAACPRKCQTFDLLKSLQGGRYLSFHLGSL